MDNGQAILLRAGGKDQLLADFTALCEVTTMDGQPKYALRPTLENLARFLTAQSGGPNKDMAVFELCHLVCALGHLLGPDCLNTFFLMPERASVNSYRVQLCDAQAQGIEVGEQAVSICYGDHRFDIRFGRMAFLGALYEFLCSMDGFGYFTKIQDCFTTMLTQPVGEAPIRTCSNAIAAELRKYRLAYLSSAQAEGRFQQVYRFLQDENNRDGPLILQDDNVLDFWCLHSQGKDYRGYRTVFDLFCDFAKAFEDSKQAEAAHRAAPLGLDREAGEVDPADVETPDMVDAHWTSPFDILDETEGEEVRFFKKKSERDPIENLMTYGPDALRLPLAFLRYEIFGQVQSGITNDLQVGRGVASVQKRMNCDAVMTYEERLRECHKILDHIKKLQASSLHVLGQDQDELVVLPNAVRQQAEQAFAKMKRKGFDKDAYEKRNLFERAAHALVAMEAQLVRYMRALEAKQVNTQFEGDRERFRQQFHTLYQEVLT